MKAEWRSAAMEYGGPSMMGEAGIDMMLSLFADNLDTKVNLKLHAYFAYTQCHASL